MEGKKRLGLVIIIFFLIFSIACAHSRGSSTIGPREPITSAQSISRSLNAPAREVPWYDNPEYAWIVPVLIVLGVGIAVGGTIYFSSGGSGLTVAVSK